MKDKEREIKYKISELLSVMSRDKKYNVWINNEIYYVKETKSYKFIFRYYRYSTIYNNFYSYFCYETKKERCFYFLSWEELYNLYDNELAYLPYKELFPGLEVKKK